MIRPPLRHRRTRAAFVLATMMPACLVTSALGAQETGARCTRELDWAAAHVARNYAGFADKVTTKTRTAYEAALAAARRSAGAATDDAQCDAAITAWVRFFADGHLRVERRATGVIDESPAALRARFADAPRVELDEGTVRRRLDALGARRSPIEGIWESGSGLYRVAILRDDARASAPSRWTMSILRADSAWWMPGQVKATFTADSSAGRYRGTFLLRDHSPVSLSTRPVRNVMLLRAEPWRRVHPVEADDLDAQQVSLLVRPTRFTVVEPAEGTLVLQLPNFSDSRAIDSLWREEGSRLRAASRLVVDLRGNSGGSDVNYRQLLPLLYTRPIREPGTNVLATDDNIAAWRALLADSARMSPAERAGVRLAVSRVEKGRGGWVEMPDGTRTFPAVLEFPQRVDVVIDRGCASSCEQFVLAARQSGKVRLYGDRTAGVLDYANVRDVRMPDGAIVLRLPTSRSRRLPAAPVDPDGIAPDVAIPSTESDWISWVLRQPASAAPPRP